MGSVEKTDPLDIIQNMSKWGEDKHREDMMLVEEAFIVMSNNLSCRLENACILWPVWEGAINLVSQIIKEHPPR